MPVGDVWQFLEMNMHSIGLGLLLFLALLVQGVPAVAQGVYVTPGANGPVFSDKPQPGSKAVDLPPINVMTAPAEVKKVPAATHAESKAAGAPVAPPPSAPARWRAGRRNRDQRH